jgi:hypothetical protein
VSMPILFGNALTPEWLQMSSNAHRLRDFGQSGKAHRILRAV